MAHRCSISSRVRGWKPGSPTRRPPASSRISRRHRAPQFAGLAWDWSPLSASLLAFLGKLRHRKVLRLAGCQFPLGARAAVLDAPVAFVGSIRLAELNGLRPFPAPKSARFGELKAVLIGDDTLSGFDFSFDPSVRRSALCEIPRASAHLRSAAIDGLELASPRSSRICSRPSADSQKARKLSARRARRRRSRPSATLERFGQRAVALFPQRLDCNHYCEHCGSKRIVA
jgi:hypothetical protein